jgi:hypothetical protein
MHHNVIFTNGDKTSNGTNSLDITIHRNISKSHNILLSIVNTMKLNNNIQYVMASCRAQIMSYDCTTNKVNIHMLCHNNKNKETHSLFSDFACPSSFVLRYLSPSERNCITSEHMWAFIYYACGNVYLHGSVLSDIHMLSKLQTSMIHTQDHVEFRTKSCVVLCTRVALQNKNKSHHWFTYM